MVGFDLVSGILEVVGFFLGLAILACVLIENRKFQVVCERLLTFSEGAS